jgi:hypothetical protein
MNWKMYSREEVNRLTSAPQPPDDNTPRVCPTCRRATMRHYYHDYMTSASPIASGTSWFWCAGCSKFACFTGPTLQHEYCYDDPLAGHIESVGQANLVSRLNLEWERGTLPQTFTRRLR